MRSHAVSVERTPSGRGWNVLVRYPAVGGETLRFAWHSDKVSADHSAARHLRSSEQAIAEVFKAVLGR